jgi:ATP-binding cassette, subfamily B, bacterial
MTIFTHYKQTDYMTCGPTCLRMVSKHYGKFYTLQELVQLSFTNREGSSLLGISEAAEKIGFRTLGVKIKSITLTSEIPLPCIAHWQQNHFVVVYKIKKHKIYVADPAHGLLTYAIDEFKKLWINNGSDEGILLLLEPSQNFYQDKDLSPKKDKRQGFNFAFDYLRPHWKAILQLIIGLAAGSILQLIFPFLTQSIVDIGISNHDFQFILLILLAQLMVFFGRTIIDIIRNYILMHVSSRVTISLVSDFFAKLMRLPISYFDSKMTGDILQRISDNQRIETFLTGASLNTIFSAFNFVVFSVVLAWYSLKIFSVFIIGSTVYFLWISFFLKRRADLDFKRFNLSSQNQSKTVELINGMQEIKLHNAERHKRWQWEALQVKLFKLNLKGLSLSTLQNSGSALINELKNIFITFLAAKLVLDGQVSLGMMLSISYIIGQLNAPVIEMVAFVQHWQDAKLSLERLSEIHSKENEDENTGRNSIPENTSIHLKNVCFKYEGAGSDMVLEDISVSIPFNKVTAIVGSSGSGKTTLLKLLLKYYEPTKGQFVLNETPFSFVTATHWRSCCGVVMQDGYIFSDTIANNIAIGEENIDFKRLQAAAETANIKDYIESLPLAYYTKIGREGNGLSGGQKQRLLIARAVYKNPQYLFFDEATSALDANNERIIMNHLNRFFQNKTVVIIAHRLSTVKNADKIIVLDKGRVVEQGTHASLTAARGTYYELVKNQLELGN